MTRTSARWTTALAAAALLATAASWLVLQQLCNGPAAPPASCLRWRAQDQLAYLLQIDSLVALGVDTEPVPYRLRARLCLRVLAAEAGGAEVAMQLRDVDYLYGSDRQPTRQAALGVPFAVHFDGGLPLRFTFPPALDGELQEHLREVLRTFQASAPRDGVDRWSVVEADTNGPFRASYARDRDGVWHRQKVAYLAGDDAAARPGQVAVLRSAADFMPAGDHSWWQTATVREELEVRSNRNLVARVATTASLRPAAWDPTSDLAPPQLSVDGLLRRPVPVLAENQAPAVTARPATAEDRQALRELLAALTKCEGKDSTLVRRIAALLREVPELALDLHPLLVDADLLAAVGASVAHALELAGTAEGQFVLTTIGGDASVPPRLRQRAIIALGGVAAPEPDSVELLWRIGQERGEVADNETAYTALLALGCMGRRLSAADAAAYATLAEGLWQVAAVSPDPERRAVALKAMANTGDKRHAPVAAAALLDSAPAVRAAAVAPLALLDDQPTLELFAERIQLERDGRVRAAIASGLRGMTSTSPATFALCAGLLGHEPQPEARGALARYLADHLADYPEGRPALEALLQRETQRDVARYVAGRVYRTPRR